MLCFLWDFFWEGRWDLVKFFQPPQSWPAILCVADGSSAQPSLTTMTSCLFSSLGDTSSLFLGLKKVSLFLKNWILAMHVSINFYIFKSFFFGTGG